MDWITYLRDQITKLLSRVTALESVSLLDYCHPIGSIYESTVNTNPGTLFGGTWVVWGAGRVSVGVDTSQTEFNTVEKTGGEKAHILTQPELPKFTPTTTVELWSLKAGGGTQEFGRGASISSKITMNQIGGDQPHNILQPYITCYMWKRTK